MTKLHELAKLGQAIWLDFIRRSFIASGDLQRLVDQGVRGVTSNPAIFEKAIAGSADYDEELKTLVNANCTVTEIYEALAQADIQHAADTLRSVYDATDGADGFVSLEVSPTLAHDTEGTVAEARRLFAAVGRPNVMIKVPATPAGVPAIETLIADGININVTLIFSLAHYEAIANAYIRGLERLAAAGGDLSRVSSVASFFVSRVDTAVDHVLEQVGASDLLGKIAVANAKAAYARYLDLFSGPRWEALAAQGALVQRPLWASTGTKNPQYSDTLYIDDLVGPDTVNTVPPDTLKAFMDHGHVEATLMQGMDEAHAQLARLSALGIDLGAITQKLQDDGVVAFANAFEKLMASISQRREALLVAQQCPVLHLGAYQAATDVALAAMDAHRVMERIATHDHTVWKPEPTEITNRLGWLDIAERMLDNVPQMEALADAVRADGYTHALLLGMGGSSLAPEVFRTTFGVKDGYLDLSVLDSTDPGAVLAYADQLDPRTTLFIVSTKSGGTVETLSFFKFFYNRTVDAVGDGAAGAHFVLITDPGSSLIAVAQQHAFRATFLNDPNIGGRYSALSYFGLVPAALLGIDLDELLRRAVAAAGVPEQGAQLGAALGELANAGRDKLTLVLSPAVASFGHWVEQLIAESTGKEGKGILPVTGEPLGAPDLYGPDRVFVSIELADDHTHDAALQALQQAGQPVIRLALGSLISLGGQFFLWELATAVAGHCMGINPFDQPNVESAKVLARRMVAAYHETGELPALTPALVRDGITVYSDVAGNTLGAVLRAFLDQGQAGAYIALQAYVQPSADLDAALLALRSRLRERTHWATTTGYGPRFLHSTGQLHKGDAGHGLFVQFTASMPRDAAIPDAADKPESGMSFGTLKMAQALGDRQALLDSGRHVIRFDLGANPVKALQQLAAVLSD